MNNDFADAYQGAREDLAIWKKRALEAEESCRKMTAALNAENGPTLMGEPVICNETPNIGVHGTGNIGFWLDRSHINDLQIATLKDLIRRAKWCSVCDVDLRENGKNVRFEADWLKHLEWQESHKNEQTKLLQLVNSIIKWKHCMSYNDSYFGEPVGELKRLAYQMDRLLASPQPSAPELMPDTVTLQFLTDVVTAAGLLAHGKRDKKLAERISTCAYELRSRLFSNNAPEQTHSAATKENAHEVMEKILWDFVEVAGAFPGAHPDPRVWPDVFAYVEMPSEIKAPQISSEHLIELARKCGIYGSYTTKEFKDTIVGYARVVLNDNAVQESFIRENNGCFTPAFGMVGKERQEHSGLNWDKVNSAAQKANHAYGQWMPERWLQEFFKAYNQSIHPTE